MLDIIYSKTGEKYSGAVKRKDAPVRQCSSTKIPVAYFLYRIHLFFFDNMKGDELMEDLLQFFCGGEEMGGDVDGGDGYYAGD